MRIRQAKKIGRKPKGTHSIQTVRNACERLFKYDECKFGKCRNMDEYLFIVDPYPQFGGMQLCGKPNSKSKGS